MYNSQLSLGTPLPLDRFCIPVKSYSPAAAVYSPKDRDPYTGNERAPRPAPGKSRSPLKATAAAGAAGPDQNCGYVGNDSQGHGFGEPGQLFRTLNRGIEIFPA